jgi:hypothetical protein
MLMRFIPESKYDPHADPIVETLGWDRIAAAIDEQAARLGPRTVVASNHNVLCGHVEIALNDSPNVYCASARRTEFDFVGRGVVPSDAPVVYVETERYPRDWRETFADRTCTLADRVDVTRAGRVVQRASIWTCPAVMRDDGAKQARK